MMNKSYLELSELKNYDDRFKYLMLSGGVGNTTFGKDRYLNQMLYHSYEWQKLRNHIIVRDNGCDLGIDGYTIYGKILIHHINPITIEDVVNRDPMIFDPNNLITISFDTHNAIHYGNDSYLDRGHVDIRSMNDTCPWKR